MYLAYVDESGNPGYPGSETYTLGCVFLESDTWPDAFDGLLSFRRFLKQKFGVHVRDELKASHLTRNSGPLSNLNIGERQRRAIFRQHMRIASKLRLSAFAAVIHKERIRNRDRYNPRDVAWEYMLQRFERLSTRHNTPVMLLHDEGDSVNVRRLARKARRANTAGSAFGLGILRLPARLLVDDPVPRQSDQSYFLQLADFIAYAAYRRLYPPPAGRYPICPAEMWSELGSACHAEANQLAYSQDPTRHPGLIEWPRN